MRLVQHRWSSTTSWTPPSPALPSPDCQLVLIFGGRGEPADCARLSELRTWYPNAIFMGCSTAGEIYHDEVLDNVLAVTAVTFEGTQIRLAQRSCDGAMDSYAIGTSLGQELASPGLRHVFVLSDGLSINGSELVNGLNSQLPSGASLSGGLAADGDRFAKTFVVIGDQALSGQVTALGLYGDRLRVQLGSRGGWDQFGPTRVITRSVRNELFELDREPALEVYKRYLGPHAERLPSSALMFPLSIHSGPEGLGTVRTILAVNESTGSMTFAGNVPEGARARFMMASNERLIDGATHAASLATSEADLTGKLAILVSCVGRRLVLGQRIDEEIEAVRSKLGKDTVMTGFYSYGEISPFTPGVLCELHNQTMTITTLAEV